jgi:Xaa-Pro dipeptidase
MLFRVMLFLFSVMFAVPVANAQPGVHTSKTGGEILRLIRNEKLDLILPGAMRDNNVEMWIHVARGRDPLVQQFGSTSGYLIFTDLGNRIERAVFGSGGAVENIDVRGSINITRAIAGYNYNNSDPRQGFSIPEVYDEITEFVAERDPKTIAVNFSDWLTSADGISYTQYLQLVKILGPKYSGRIVSAENVITDFLSRRTLREVTAMTNTVEMNRQNFSRALSRITPGVTTIGDITWWANQEAFKRGLLGYSTWSSGGLRVYYSAVSEPIEPPDVRWWIRHPDYVLQRGDYFIFNTDFKYMGFGTDSKVHAYILREGETSVPESMQKVFDLGIKALDIMRPHMKVGMTGGESLAAMVKAMEDAGYIYTPFFDNGTEDYKMIQNALANTNKPGFSIDNHAFGNNGGSLRVEGPSMAPFRVNTHNLKIQANHIFAYEYMIHMNIPERPGFPLAMNFSNPQIISSRGVELLRQPKEEIVLIH